MIVIITTKEAAQWLQVSESTIKRYINSGELKAAKIGNSWRIREESIIDFVKQKEKAQSEPKLVEIR